MTLCPQLRRLSAEHARWREELERGAREDGGERAMRVLALWDSEILPHCRAEEEVLLPELSRRLSETDATVVFTFGDHLALRRLARELRTSGAADRDEARARLERRIAEHAAFEDGTLFPALQETLGCDRLAALAAEVAAAREASTHRPAESPRAAHTRMKKGTKP